MPQALKSCPKYNKSSNLVTLLKQDKLIISRDHSTKEYKFTPRLSVWKCSFLKMGHPGLFLYIQTIQIFTTNVMVSVLCILQSSLSISVKCKEKVFVFLCWSLWNTSHTLIFKKSWWWFLFQTFSFLFSLYKLFFLGK